MPNDLEIPGNLDEKRDLIVDAVRLGMGLNKAYVYARCTDSEKEILEKDRFFQERIQYSYAQYEYDLLTLHTAAMVVSSRKGATGAIEWRLSKINPSRWGTRELGQTNEMPTIVFDGVDHGLI